MIKFSKTRNVITPSYGTSGSNGLDMFIPMIDSKFEEDFKELNEVAKIRGNEIIIPPNSTAIIPLGIKFNFSQYPGTALVAMNRSGIGSGGVIRLACVIDSDYQGEVYASVHNLNKYEFKIKENKAIVQLLHIPVFRLALSEIDGSELWDTVTERSDGTRNSTNR